MVYFRLRSLSFCSLCVTVFKIPVSTGNKYNQWTGNLHHDNSKLSYDTNLFSNGMKINKLADLTISFAGI